MKKNILASALLAVSVLATSSKLSAQADPLVAGKNIAVTNTDLGKVRGYIHNGTIIYKGIPYAQAERFMPPTRPKAWNDLRSSTAYGPVCPTDPTTTVFDPLEFAFNHNWGYSNENCQTLNIWSQGINDGKKRPVMVWLHGGGFSAGSAIELPSYEGENLSKKGDVVVVSINHRLNVLGFLDLSSFGEKYKKSANVGMMDIVMALEWVKNNIANFGGDPNNVTIFGQSGGGAKVTTLMYAPTAKGLFHKAINQSGSYRQSFLEQEDSRKVGEALLEVLGLKPSQVDSLQKISYEKLNEASKKAIAKVQEQMKKDGKAFVGGGLGWGPVHDGDFLPYQQVDPAGLAISKDIPFLVGCTKNEFMASLINPAIRDFTKEQAVEFLKIRYANQTDAYLKAVEKAYPNTTKPSDYIDIDLAAFRPGMVKHANLKADFGGAPVYAYLFTWQSPVNDGMYKAVHCIELGFVFNNIDRCQEMTGGGKEAKILEDKMSWA